MRSTYSSLRNAGQPAYLRRQLERGVSQTANVSAKSSSGCFCAYQPAMWRTYYRPIPFSRKYVRHMAGWYAQKHPDEDFAETFAVWLTPRSQWRKRYKDWDALAKLQYVDHL